jgi:hypothetical protein
MSAHLLPPFARAKKPRKIFKTFGRPPRAATAFFGRAHGRRNRSASVAIACLVQRTASPQRQTHGAGPGRPQAVARGPSGAVGRRSGRRSGGTRVKRDQRGQKSAVSRRRGGGYRQCPLTSSPLRARVKLPRKALKTLSPSAAHGPMPFSPGPLCGVSAAHRWRLPSWPLCAEPAEPRHGARRTARGLGAPRWRRDDRARLWTSGRRRGGGVGGLQANRRGQQRSAVT